MSSLPELLTRRDRAPSWLKRAQQRGHVVGVLPGVYLRDDVANDLRWRARAVMVWRPDSVLCGALPARLTFWKDLEVDTIDVATRTSIQRAGYRFVERVLPTALRVRYGHLTITVPALTALDLSLTVGPEALDRALRSRLVTVEMLTSALAATPGRAGNRERRRRLAASRTRPWSAAERLAHRLLREAGITGWVANEPIPVGDMRCYLDIAFPGVRLAIEIDGYEVHSLRDVFEDDRERQNELVLAGWTVLRFTYRQMVARPEEMVAAVRRGLRVAATRHRRATRARGQIAP